MSNSTAVMIIILILFIPILLALFFLIGALVGFLHASSLTLDQLLNHPAR